MKDAFTNSTDDTILAEMGRRLATIRLQRNITQDQLAREAGISKSTLVRLESGSSSQTSNLIRVLRALRLLENLDGLLPPPLPSPLAELRLKRSQRRRAVPKPVSQKPTKPWVWGDEKGDGKGKP